MVWLVWGEKEINVGERSEFEVFKSKHGFPHYKDFKRIVRY